MHEYNPPSQARRRSKFAKTGLLSLPIAVYLTLLLLPAETATQSAVLVFLGRFHPLILHFPIVLILLTTAFVLLGRLNPLFEKPIIIRSLFGSTVFFTLVAILAGYLLYISDAYSGALARNHFYGALLTGGAITVCFLLYEWAKSKNKANGPVFFSFLALTNLSLAYTSHMGGSLTHGEDYLSEPLAGIFPAEIEQKDPEEMLLYADIVATVLESKCVNCHNENKSKGDLLLDSYEALLSEGKSGKQAVVPGNPDESELMVRVRLPEGHDDRMPPEGKPGLTAEEHELLALWIANGADPQVKKGEVDDANMQASLEQMMPAILRAQYKILEDKAAFEAAQQALETIATGQGVSIAPDKQMNNKYFGLKMKFPPAPFGTEQLKAYTAYFPYFSKVSLASTDIVDDDLFYLGKMTELRELVLQKTALTGEGLPYLKDLPHLETLNLSFTPLEDAHLLHLLSYQNLKKVYLFGTPLKQEIVEAFRKHKPDIAVIMEEGPYY
ncbi:Planctomycete cytochrome C [Cyclobacterium lianum]|uniref:Planctomycete cytochrome C n=1 Tax=Cyclobacterium lianum TaxID=388280 RepID=A0A1M7PDL4_9BACT|nr:c-type cytochrome domain-containing protein [Cyclobacterium lianum]SHN15011.1 Planctomycete cytochrome C [Cyclobacterium lianum]